MMKELTLEQLKVMPPLTIFATGTVSDNLNGINMSNSDKLLRWVAVRGGIHDWAIYYHFAESNAKWIRSFGDKVRSEFNIKKLVTCNDEVLDMYKY